MNGQVTISLFDFDRMRDSEKFRSDIYEIIEQYKQGIGDKEAFKLILDIAHNEKMRIIRNGK